MLSVIGSLIGFASSAVPSVIDHFKERQNKKHELELVKLQYQLMRENADIDFKVFQARAGDDEHARLIAHDTSMQNDTGIIGALRKSVRPVITYMFFALFAAVKVTGLVYALDSNDLQEALLMIWDGETQAIFAAIISFWFGRRALEKKGA